MRYVFLTIALLAAAPGPAVEWAEAPAVKGLSPDEAFRKLQNDFSEPGPRNKKWLRLVNTIAKDTSAKSTRLLISTYQAARKGFFRSSREVPDPPLALLYFISRRNYSFVHELIEKEAQKKRTLTAAGDYAFTCLLEIEQKKGPGWLARILKKFPGQFAFSGDEPSRDYVSTMTCFRARMLFKFLQKDPSPARELKNVSDTFPAEKYSGLLMLALAHVELKKAHGYALAKKPGRWEACEKALTKIKSPLAREDLTDLARKQGVQIPDTFAFSDEIKFSRRPVRTPGENFKNVLGVKMVWIPPGRFVMGSDRHQQDEKPAHPVTLSGFFMAETPLTQKQMKTIFPDWPEPAVEKNLPATGVTYYEAKAAARWLSRREKGIRYMLPGEAQWERAARNGKSKKPYPSGDKIDPDIMIFGRKKPVSVFTPEPDSFGVRGMVGNVQAWCRDAFLPYRPSKAPDPVATGWASRRAVRGAAWFNCDDYLRVSYREGLFPDESDRRIGVRLAAVPEQEK